jgi:hypothetical protein
LILILALVTILTLLVILILTRATIGRQMSSTSAGQQKADQLAQGALQEILNDCRQEIAAGSRPLPANSASYNSQNVYFPTNNQTIVPAYAGYSPTSSNDPFPNLLKRSAYGVPFFPATNSALYNANNYPPSNLASPLNTASSSSVDGRSISSARWNKPMLMDPNQLAKFTAPDWTLVTRSGPQAFAAWDPTLKDNTSTTNYVIGRYAYTIYDEGGLLDANTAGCATSLTTDFDKSSKRGRLGQADLTAIPGLAQADIDKLVLWRNATTANAAQSYFTYLFHGLFSSGIFQYNTNTPADTTAAFTTVLKGDQTFTSRQDLLDFFDFTFGSGSAQAAALPYLGTFSRELNAPSYCPPNPNATANNTISVASVPSQYLYADNAEQASSINRNFPSVKFANGGTLFDGTTVVKAGDPLVRRRFALSRLQLIQNKISNPADTSKDTLIHNYFGLIYDTASGKWIYTSPDSTTVASSIKTLEQVAQINSPSPREPDFFELLQAGILNGSLGQTAGTDSYGNSTSGSETVQYDSCPDSQVIQIGANIISQCNTATTPLTTITYSPVAPGNVALGPIDFYGIQNIPYISKISQVIYREEKPGIDPVTGYGNPYDNNKPFHRPFVSAWFQIELWNPHQQPENSPQLPMQIYAVGDAETVIFNGGDNNGGTSYYPWVDGSGVSRPSLGVSPKKNFNSSETINIPSGAYASADYFREPRTLTPSLGVTTSLPEDHLQESNIYSTTQWDFIGFKTGDAFGPDDSAGDEVFNQYMQNPPTGPCQFMNPFFAGVTSSQGITFYLQVKNPSTGNWVTVQTVKQCIVQPDSTVLPSCWVKRFDPDPAFMVPAHSEYKSQINGNDYKLNQNPNYTLGCAFRMLIDPRTDRFGVFEGVADSNGQFIGPHANETMLPTTVADTGRGLFGDYTNYDRMRTPTQESNYSWQGGVTYANPNWYDGRKGLGYWDTKMPGDGLWAPLLMFNSKTLTSQIYSGVSYYNASSAKSDYTYYYADPDGIIRGGDAYYANGSDQDGNGFPDAFSAYMGTTGTPRPERPVVLNRPFRTVGELGYVHRGELWKSLDFFTPDSGDAGLLDLFSIDDEDVVAGTVDLNTRQAPVLQAVLQGEVKNELATSSTASGDPVISNTDASALSKLLVAERFGASSQTGPLANRSELVTRFLAQNTASTNYTAFPLNKARREAVVRPLAAVGNTRTWNLLIDIIAQSGRYPTTANDLTQFQIEGEKRYWWHVAIDRFTGQIVASQLEPVYE